MSDLKTWAPVRQAIPRHRTSFRAAGQVAQWLGVTLLLSGCSIVAGLSKFDDATPAPVLDSANPPPDPAGARGSDFDGGLATPVGSAEADAGGRQPAVVPTGKSFCATVTPPPKFCADWDRSPDLADGWQPPYLPGNAQLTIFAGGAQSTAGALLAKSTAITAGQVAEAILVKKFPVRPTRFKLAFDFKIVQVDPRAESEVLKIELGGYQGWTLALELQATSARLLEVVPHLTDVSTFNSIPLTRLPGTAGWTRVSFDLDVTGQQLSLAFDGVSQLTDVEVTPSSMPTAPIDFIVGINYEKGPLSATQFLTDNVTVDYSTP